MSAIFGVIYKDGKPVSESCIQTMQQALLHRAVDGKHFWSDDSVFLGQHAHYVSTVRPIQLPLFEEDGLVIFADAVLYNRQYLCSLLEIPAGQSKPVSDEALILSAYRRWGKDCVVHLDGEFVFAIWNKKEHTLFLAADHMGFRPVYYHDTPGMFLFSSEMKGILAVKETDNYFNEEAIIDYFFRQADYTQTYTKGIQALCGGSRLILKNGHMAVDKYWLPRIQGKYNFKKDSDWADCLRELLWQAVDNRLHTDLPVGIGLSGGLDSSSIACIAGQILARKNKQLFAFSSVLPPGHTGVECDERPYISAIGKHLGNVQQVFVEATGKGPFSDLEEAFAIEETAPNPFFYMDRALNEAAQQNGIGTYLSGYGGDFLVSSGGNYALIGLLKKMRITEVLNLLREFHSNEGRSYYQVIKRELIARTELYRDWSRVRHKGRINWQEYTPLSDNLLNKYAARLDFEPVKDPAAFMVEYIATGNLGRSMGRFANRDAKFHMRPAVPMFDRHVTEFMLDVPMEQFIVGGVKRSLIRRAMEGVLPPEIQWRRDKISYSPDYIDRIKKNKQFINSVTTSESYNFVWQYFDKAKFPDIEKMESSAGMTRPWDVSGIRISQTVIFCVFLKWLTINQFKF